MKKITFLLVSVACVLGMASAASAGDYAGGTATVAGDTVTVTVSGCDPSTTANGELKDSGGSTAATGSGTVGGDGTVSIVFNGVAEGTYSAEVTCDRDGTPVVQTVNGITVAGDSVTATTGGALPETGSDSSLPLARLGIVLVAAGGVAIYAGQKRRSMMRIDA